MNNDINSVLSQMRAIEQMARSQPLQPIGVEQKSGPSFADMMQNAINQVNETRQHSADLSRRLEMGDPKVDLAEVMIAGQKSTIAFQALTEVRNKLLTAYQDVMNMPV